MAWAELLKKTRAFFDSRGFVEVWTEQLVEAGAFEAVIDPLVVRLGNTSRQLHTSAEIEMKQILAETQKPIYQVCKVFRDDPATEIHWREFTMLELYQPGLDLNGLKQLTKSYLKHVATPLPLIEETTIRDSLLGSTGIDIEKAQSKDELRKSIVDTRAIEISLGDSWEDMFFKLLIEKVEPSFSHETLTFLSGYPTSVSPLSEEGPSGIAERFEIYWKGMEIGNGCVELRDLKELKRRYQSQSDQRSKEGKLPHPMPNRLYEALPRLPKCSGIAIGMDRLFDGIYSSVR